MEITNKEYGTPRYKSTKLSTWKTRGVIHDDFDTLFEQYIKTKVCQHCAKPFTSLKDRCLDHDHTTGFFRAVVCKSCNSFDSYIKYPDGDYDCTEQRKQYRENNKDKIKEQVKQYYENNKDKLKEQMKQYYEQYRENNKDKLNEKQKQKIQCICGSLVRRNDLQSHKRREKHLKLMDVYINSVD